MSAVIGSLAMAAARFAVITEVARRCDITFEQATIRVKKHWPAANTPSRFSMDAWMADLVLVADQACAEQG